MAKLEKGINDLLTTHPELSTEWHPTKNGDLTPDMVSAGSGKQAWWLLHYDVPMDYPIEHLRGKHFDFEWEAEIKSRAKGTGCPFLSGKAVWPGFNDLATTHPRLVKEWHKSKNKGLTPEMVTAGSNKKVWWRANYKDNDTGCHHKHEWEAQISQRATGGTQCPQKMSSKGEKLVRTVLEVQGIKFIEQNTFADRTSLDGKHLLRDDFAVLDSKGKIVGTIEFHGRQHYELTQFGGKNQTDAEKRFKDGQERDKIKSDYLKSHGIKQFVISYKDMDKIQELVNGFIKELASEHELIKPKRVKMKKEEVEKFINPKDPVAPCEKLQVYNQNFSLGAENREDFSQAPWSPPSQSKVDKQQVKDFMAKIMSEDSKSGTQKKTGKNLGQSKKNDVDISF